MVGNGKASSAFAAGTLSYYHQDCLLLPHQQKCPVQIKRSISPLAVGVSECFFAFGTADEDGADGGAGEGHVVALGEAPGEEICHGSGGDGGGDGGAGAAGEENRDRAGTGTAGARGV